VVLSGVLVAAAIAAVAWVAGAAVPLVGAPVLAMLLGLGARTTLGLPAALRPGVDFTLKRLLRLAIVLFGATLSFADVIRIGGASVAVVGATVVLALLLTTLIGRALRAPDGLVGLIGVGTAICGATAILTVGPIVEAREEEIAFAVTTIFLFNLLAVVVYPLLGHGLALPDATFGVWAGAAIHDTSSVLAAAFAYSESSGQTATVVKLTRTLVLVPLALAYGIAHSARTPGRGGRVRVAKIFPWFVLWFAAAALLNTAGAVGPDAERAAGLAGRFLVVMVMAAVGLSADLARMRAIGLRPLYVGLAASVVIAAVSLGLIEALTR